MLIKQITLQNFGSLKENKNLYSRQILIRM